MLPVEDDGMFLRQYYAVYGSNQKLKCQGDGETAERRDDKGKISQISCPSPEGCDFAKKFGCRARIDLMVVLPDVNCGGVYQLSSGSINTDIDIRSGIEMARHVFGRISWVPMMLKREDRKIPDPETGKMMTHWPVSLYPQASVSEVNQIREDTKRILDRQAKYSLPEPVIEGEFTAESDEGQEASQTTTPEPQDSPNNDVDAMIGAMGLCNNKEQLDKLIRQNFSGINALKHSERVRLITAKDEIEARLPA